MLNIGNKMIKTNFNSTKTSGMVCEIEIKKILMTCVVATDDCEIGGTEGIECIAAVSYMAKHLLEFSSVTLVILVLPDSEQIGIAKCTMMTHIQNIDTAGYYDLKNNYHVFKRKFEICVIDESAKNVYIYKQQLLVRFEKENYDVVLTGPSAGIPGIHPTNVPIFEYLEFGMPHSDNYANTIVGGLGPGTGGIYFDEEMGQSLLWQNTYEKVNFLKQYEGEFKTFLGGPIDFSQTDVYISYGKCTNMSKFYVGVAKRLSGDRYCVIFVRSEYIAAYGHLYNKFNNRFYWMDKTILIVGLISEMDLKKVILFSNKIVHCAGDLMISQVISAKKIPLCDHTGHTGYFITQLYSMMTQCGIEVAQYLLSDINMRGNMDKFVELVYELIAKDSQIHKKLGIFYDVVKRDYQLFPNAYNKMCAFLMRTRKANFKTKYEKYKAKYLKAKNEQIKID